IARTDSTASFISSIRRRFTASVNSIRRMAFDSSTRARIAAHRHRRYFRLSLVVAPLGVSASFCSRFSDGVDLLLHLLGSLGDTLVGDLLVVEDHQLADRALAGVELVAEVNHP